MGLAQFSKNQLHNFLRIEMPEVLRGKYQYFTQAEVGKLRATGYSRAMTPLTDAVKDYVQGYMVTGKKLGDQ